jgi:hypothetical protein
VTTITLDLDERGIPDLSSLTSRDLYRLAAIGQSAALDLRDMERSRRFVVSLFFAPEALLCKTTRHRHECKAISDYRKHIYQVTPSSAKRIRRLERRVRKAGAFPDLWVKQTNGVLEFYSRGPERYSKWFEDC